MGSKVEKDSLACFSTSAFICEVIFFTVSSTS